MYLGRGFRLREGETHDTRCRDRQETGTRNDRSTAAGYAARPDRVASERACVADVATSAASGSQSGRADRTAGAARGGNADHLARPASRRLPAVPPGPAGPATAARRG